jgi:acyl-CoA synthetase (AMP-forming)/AMP-acid ligase II
MTAIVEVQTADVSASLMAAIDRHAGAIALRARGQEITYADLGRRVVATTESLRREGFTPNERVLFSVRPGIDAIVLAVAVMRAGGVLVFADPGMGAELFERRLAGVPISWAMAESILYAASSPGPLRWLLARRGLTLPHVGKLPVRHVRTGRRWPGVPRSLELDRLQSGPNTDRGCTPSPDGDALIVFTSGTTEDPRAVVHSQVGLARTLHLVNTLLGMQPGHILYSDELHTILPALIAGATVVFPSRNASPKQRLSELITSGATHTFMVPSDMQSVLDVCRDGDRLLLSKLATILLGSAPVGPHLIEQIYLWASPDTKVWCVYAMTEMLPVCVISGTEKLAYAGRGDLVGRPVDGVRVAVSDDGELVVAGPHLSRGIVGHAPRDEHRTGDLGSIDESGRVVLTGRHKQMIIRGHHNIYPGLYEPQILGVPGVRACAMVGVYDQQIHDERVVLLLEPESEEYVPALVARVRAQINGGICAIDLWARPDVIAIANLPRGGRSNKIDLAAVHSIAAECIQGTSRTSQR